MATGRAEAVLFDLDGTLVDTNELIVRSFQHVGRRYLGRELDPEREIHPTFGEPLEAVLARLAPGRGPELVAAYRQFYWHHHDRWVRPFPGAAEALAALKAAGVGVAVVTSKLRRTAERGIELCGLRPWVDCLVAVDDGLAPKPAPDPVLRALSLLRASPDRSLLVGDSPHDIEAAHAAGTRAVAVLWSVYPRQRLRGADAFAASFRDVLALAGVGPGASGAACRPAARRGAVPPRRDERVPEGG